MLFQNSWGSNSESLEKISFIRALQQDLSVRSTTLCSIIETNTQLILCYKYFTAKSARQNRGYEQEEMKDEAAKPSLDQKHGWQVKRSLDTELYRNVELEVWEDSKNGKLLITFSVYCCLGCEQFKLYLTHHSCL